MWHVFPVALLMLLVYLEYRVAENLRVNESSKQIDDEILIFAITYDLM